MLKYATRGRDWGGKTLAEVCKSVEIGVTHCVGRLSAKGFNMTADEKLKQVAVRYEINPIDILKMLLEKDYKPES